MKLVKFRASHLAALTLQPAQAGFGLEFANPDYGLQLEASTAAFTGLSDDGAVIGCAGVQEVWRGRAVAWALLSGTAGQHFKAIHRAAHGFFQQGPWQRIEAFVDADFKAGQRWVTMLGFTNETPNAPMRKYTPDGKDCFLYSRVK